MNKIKLAAVTLGYYGIIAMVCFAVVLVGFGQFFSL